MIIVTIAARRSAHGVAERRARTMPRADPRPPPSLYARTRSRDPPLQRQPGCHIREVSVGAQHLRARADARDDDALREPSLNAEANALVERSGRRGRRNAARRAARRAAPRRGGGEVVRERGAHFGGPRALGENHRVRAGVERVRCDDRSVKDVRGSDSNCEQDSREM